VKQLFRVIQGHLFGDHRNAIVEGLHLCCRGSISYISCVKFPNI